MAPTPKPPGTQQRRNKRLPFTTIEDEPRPSKRPKLPVLAEGEAWHPHVLAWWKDMWRSRLAEEYIRLDLHGLYVCAWLYQRFWTSEDVRTMKELAAELAKQLARYGQSPLDRRRLQIEIKRAEATEPVRKPTRQNGQVGDGDPRRLLSAV